MAHRDLQTPLAHREADEAQVPFPASPRVLSVAVKNTLVANASRFLRPTSHTEARRSAARLKNKNGAHGVAVDVSVGMPSVRVGAL